MNNLVAQKKKGAIVLDLQLLATKKPLWANYKANPMG